MVVCNQTYVPIDLPRQRLEWNMGWFQSRFACDDEKYFYPSRKPNPVSVLSSRVNSTPKLPTVREKFEIYSSVLLSKNFEKI